MSAHSSASEAAAAGPACLPDNLPAELKTLPQWVVWRLQPNPDNPDKPKKVPFNPATGRAASVKNPATWGTFDAALARYQSRSWWWQGLGFVFAGNGVTGIDLDNCVSPNGTAEPKAAALVEKFATYAELSQSRRGIHLICKATLPDHAGRRKDERGIEIYDSGRFFALTGDVEPFGARPITERQEQVNALLADLDGSSPPGTSESSPPRSSESSPPETPTCASSLTDRELLDKARAAGNGGLFGRLFDGDTSDYDGDRSRADFVLCGLLCFWCNGNAGHIDRLFRQSGLMRDKWDSKRGTSTYGADTIRKALKSWDGTGYSGRSAGGVNHDQQEADSGAAGSREQASTGGGAGHEPAWIRGDKLLAMEFPPPRWLLPDLIPDTGLCLLTGRPKSGKSWWALGLALAVAYGGRFLGRDIPQGKALYLALEDTPRRLKSRLLILQPDCAGNLALCNVAFRTTAPRWGSGLEQELEKVIAGGGVTLVILDTLQKVRPLGAVNGSQYADDYNVVGSLQAFANKHNLCLLVLHHQRKQGAEGGDVHDTISGTQGIGGAIDGSLILERKRGGDGSAVLYATGRDLGEGEHGLKFDGGFWSYAGTAEQVRASREQNEVLDVLKGYGSDGSQNDAALRKATGKQERNLRNLLAKLVDAKRVRVRHVGKAIYYAACDGPNAGSGQAQVVCPKCGGTGNVGYGPKGGLCFECHGTGKASQEQADDYHHAGPVSPGSDSSATTHTPVNEEESVGEEKDSVCYSAYSAYSACSGYSAYSGSQAGSGTGGTGRDTQGGTATTSGGTGGIGAEQSPIPPEMQSASGLTGQAEQAEQAEQQVSSSGNSGVFEI